MITIKKKPPLYKIEIYYESLCIPSLRILGLLLNSIDYLDEKKKLFEI